MPLAFGTSRHIGGLRRAENNPDHFAGERNDRPEAVAQRDSIDGRLQRQAALETDGESIQFQADCIGELISATDYPMFDPDTVVEIFVQWTNDKQADVLTYRGAKHRSVMTGTLAARVTPAVASALAKTVQRCAFLGSGRVRLRLLPTSAFGPRRG